jgi:hypothetical protein
VTTTSKKRKSVYAKAGFWREKDGSIHMSLQGVPGFHVAINEDPKKPNGHPTLFKRLDKLLNEAAEPPDVTIQFVDSETRQVSKSLKLR